MLLSDLSVWKKIAVYNVNIIDIAFIHLHCLQPSSVVAAVEGSGVVGGLMYCIYSAEE